MWGTVFLSLFHLTFSPFSFCLLTHIKLSTIKSASEFKEDHCHSILGSIQVSTEPAGQPSIFPAVLRSLFPSIPLSLSAPSIHLTTHPPSVPPSVLTPIFPLYPLSIHPRFRPLTGSSVHLSVQREQGARGTGSEAQRGCSGGSGMSPDSAWLSVLLLRASLLPGTLCCHHPLPSPRLTASSATPPCSGQSFHQK